MTDTPSVALLGTGTMGVGMAHALLRAGLRVTAWNRTVDKARPLEGDGATVASTVAEAVRDADVVLTMLFDADSVERVMSEAAPAMREDAVWLQTSTVGPEATRRLAAFAGDHSLTLVDSPVLGTKAPAEQGTLVVLVAGPSDAVDRAAPVLDAIGARTVRLGEQPGAASALKIAANTFIGTLTVAVAQSVALAEAQGLDPADLLAVLAGGASDSPYLQAKGRAMVEGATGEVQFELDGALKDMRIAREVAGRTGVALPVIEAVVDAYERASSTGHGDEDMGGVVAAFRPKRT